MSDTSNQVLADLALLQGIQTSYRDVEGNLRMASPEALLSILQAMGVPMGGLDDAASALRWGRMRAWRRRMPQVTVAWDGAGMNATLRLPRADASGRGYCTLKLEDGSSRQWSLDLEHLPILETAPVEGVEHVALKVEVKGSALPLGYHHLMLDAGGVETDTAVFCAPKSVYRPQDSGRHRSWGLFAPVYALRSKESWGAGDLSDLRRLMDLAEPMGASTFAILPMLATFLEEGKLYAHSPYMPVSRLFWSEFYLDPAIIPELSHCAEARELMASPAFQAERASLDGKQLIDYPGVMAQKRRVLELLAASLVQVGGSRLEEFQSFVASRPELTDYAGFRSACERHQASWRTWSQKERDGDLEAGDLTSVVSRYHRYVQWVMHEQLSGLAERARRDGEGLYLDLPVGIHPDGYDAWRHRGAFALATSAGAPPDPFFTRGQDWGFPPLDPAGSRDEQHRYFIASIRSHLRYAGILRIDHVMGLHRLFWVPRGLGATEGVYVRYPAEELYAVLCLESQRASARIIGENLGTVPDYVNEEMDRRSVQRMYVGQFSMSTDPAEGLLAPDPESLASMNTHDMPTFASFWKGTDVKSRIELRMIDDAKAREESDMRGWQRKSISEWLVARGELAPGLPPKSDEETFAVLAALLRVLADSEAESLLVSLEDLWLELDPQNIPGTYLEHPNWQRRMRRGIEDVVSMDQVLGLLRDIDDRRRR